MSSAETSVAFGTLLLKSGASDTRAMRVHSRCQTRAKGELSKAAVVSAFGMCVLLLAAVACANAKAEEGDFEVVADTHESGAQAASDLHQTELLEERGRDPDGRDDLSRASLRDLDETWQRLSATVRRDEAEAARKQPAEALNGADPMGVSNEVRSALEAISALYERVLREANSANTRSKESEGLREVASTEETSSEGLSSGDVDDAKPAKAIAKEALALLQQALKRQDRSAHSASIRKLVESHSVSITTVHGGDGARDFKLVVSLAVQELAGIPDGDINVKLVDTHNRELQMLEFFRGDDQDGHSVLYAVISHQEALRLLPLRQHVFLVVTRKVARLPPEDKPVYIQRLSDVIPISKLVEIGDTIQAATSHRYEPWRQMVQILEPTVFENVESDDSESDEEFLSEDMSMSFNEVFQATFSGSAFGEDTGLSSHEPEHATVDVADTMEVADHEDELVQVPDPADNADIVASRDLMGRVEEAMMDGRRTKEAIKLLTEGIALGDADAMATLAAMYLSGDGDDLERNIALGLRYAHEAAADHGHPDAQAILALAHEFGAAGILEKDADRALLLWTLAANGGSLLARASLAFKFLHGLGVESECQAAAILYQQNAMSTLGLDADDAENPEGAELLSEAASEAIERRTLERRTRLREEHLSALTRVPSPRRTAPSRISPQWRAANAKKSSFSKASSENDMVGYYQHVASTGNVNAMVAVGYAQLHGLNGMEPDAVAAREMFEAAAQAGNAPVAHANLAYMHIKGIGGLPMDNRSAFAHYEKAARMGDDGGKNGLGFCYLNGVGVERSPEVAFQYFANAAQGGYEEAMYNLGVLYTQGLGTQQSLSSALAWFLKAAHKGHVHSMFQAAILLYDPTASSQSVPRGLDEPPKDCARAVRLYKQVAELGELAEIVSAAEDFFWDGDFESALYRYLQAAVAGVELAQYNAAFMLDQGIGIVPWFGTNGSDDARNAATAAAARLYELSSFQGHGPSFVKLGHLAYKQAEFERSIRSYESGMQFQTSSAESMFNLAVMHMLGRGVQRDDSLAKRYFDMAGNAHPDAFYPVFFALNFLWIRTNVERAFAWLGISHNSTPDSISVAETSDAAEVPSSTSELGLTEKRSAKLGARELELDIIVVIFLAGALLSVLWLRYARRRRRQLRAQHIGREHQHQLRQDSERQQVRQ
mmetsp:Transcript_738/g.1938  ORF Transcript_738/g.1938 Transcript_738/m.1938 type:complete len:1177 (-) Transcript_738:63-3593(-)